MARPETLEDIEVNETVQFASIEVDKISTDGALLKAYATFLEAVQKAGSTVEAPYSTANISRPATMGEMMKQLASAQITWDANRDHYETLRVVGKLEYNFQEKAAEKWAEKEGLPFPPVSEEIKSLDVVIRDIDEAVSEA
jgi:cytochrome oxidase Cu insertion factor (SCO1/SenC/PrrC family)